MRNRGFVSLIVGSALLLGMPARGWALTQCTTYFNWKCADHSPNQCIGNLDPGGTEPLTESVSSPHELFQVIRFTGLPNGTHKMEMSYAAQGVNSGQPTNESLVVGRYQANGCDDSSSPYQIVHTFDTPSGLADYDLSASGTTDICLSFTSDKVNPDQDEFLVFNNAASLPSIVSTLERLAKREVTNPGTVVSGSYQDTLLSDNVREHLQEGGSQHRLFHVYQIDGIPAGSSQTLYVEGYRPDNTDGDDFNILYKWLSSGNCTTTGLYLNSGMSINSSTESGQTATLTNSSGTLCVAVDDSTNGSNNDDVYIDHVYISTGGITCGP